MSKNFDNEPINLEPAYTYLLSKLEGAGEEMNIALSQSLPLDAFNLRSATFQPYGFDFEQDFTDQWGRPMSRGFFIVDVDEGNPRGFGVVSLQPSSEDEATEGIPVVLYTETEEDKRGHGYGVDRLRAMNSVTLSQYGAVLYSDVEGNMASEARSCWEKLVACNEATLLPTDTGIRYKFK